MSTDADIVSSFDSRLSAQLHSLKTQLTRISAARNADEAAGPLFDAEAVVREGDALLKAFEKERRHLSHEAKQGADRRVKQHEQQWAQQKTMLGDYKRKYTANAGAATSGSAPSMAQQQEWRDQRARLLETRGVQQGNAASLLQTQRTIEDSVVVGTHTSVMLEHQTEQMVHVRDTLKETDDVLDKSKRLLKRMRTRLVTNKLVTFMIVLLELGIIALIIYVKYYS